MASARPSTADFDEELKSQLARATASGAKHKDVTSRNLHDAVGGYSGTGGNHAMPSCCNAMYKAQRAGDVILSRPPSGKGATLTIRYRLPRRAD